MQTIHITWNRCLRHYGFYANPKYSLQKNFNIQISQEQPITYMHQVI